VSDVLVVEGLNARYGQVHVLDDVALDVRAGEVVAVVGPNGAGKTTLLRTLSGLVRERSGSVRLDGTEIGALRPHRIARAGLAHVPEGRGTLASLTVEENLLLGAQGRSPKQAAARAATMYDAFPVLGRLRANRAGLLSGGEQQMLVVARGLMGEPKLLAIDEPSMGLAPIMIRELIEMLRTAVATGVAVLLVEQNTALAAELADRVYVLVRGTVRAERAGGDLPADLLADYLV
jgi:branched-chain amino acid transport system ATP-binding protein